VSPNRILAFLPDQTDVVFLHIGKGAFILHVRGIAVGELFGDTGVDGGDSEVYE